MCAVDEKFMEKINSGLRRDFSEKWVGRCRKQEMVISAGICVIGSNNFSNYVEHFAKHETFSAEIAINKNFKFSLRFLRFFLKQSPLHSNACMQCNHQEKKLKKLFHWSQKNRIVAAAKKNFGKHSKQTFYLQRKGKQLFTRKNKLFSPARNFSIKNLFPEKILT